MTSRHPSRNAPIRVLTNRLKKATSALPAATIVLLMIAIPVKAHADIIWTLPFDKTTFGGGGVENGTFTTDDLGNLLSFDLTTTAGGVFPATTYDSMSGGVILSASTVSFTISDHLNSNFSLSDVLNAPLTLSNSPDFLAEAVETRLAPFAERFNTGSPFIPGSPTAAVPVPSPGPIASLALLAIGLFLLRPRANRRDRQTHAVQPEGA